MSRVRQVGSVTVQVNVHGVVVWCDDWAELLRLALRGHTSIKPGPHGGVIWVG
jgi:hypothetical protein